MTLDLPPVICAVCRLHIHGPTAVTLMQNHIEAEHAS